MIKGKAVIVSQDIKSIERQKQNFDESNLMRVKRPTLGTNNGSRGLFDHDEINVQKVSYNCSYILYTMYDIQVARQLQRVNC